MADEARVPITHWAVLIGINFYVGDKCLQGSVKDVQVVKQYLDAVTTLVDIAILTATTPSDPRSRNPVKSPDLWPTYKNVIARLQRVLEKARRKDSDHRPKDLTFVLFDNIHGCRYLIGEILAKCLNRMVAKGTPCHCCARLLLLGKCPTSR
jgi:Caspase domain